MPPSSSPPPGSTVTLRSIAQATGHHASTVSLALRNDPRLKPETRQQIREAASALGYRINPLVQSVMRAHRSRRKLGSVQVALLHVEPLQRAADNNHFYTGIRRGAENLQIVVDAFPFSPVPSDCNRLLDILNARRVAGVIFGASMLGYSAESLDLTNLAAVAIGHSLKRPAIGRVLFDHFEWVIEHVQTCVARGASRIGMIVRHPHNSGRQLRWVGAFAAAQTTFKGTCQLYDPLVLSWQSAKWPEEIRAWLQTHPLDVILDGGPFASLIEDASKELGLLRPHIVPLESNPRTQENNYTQSLEALGAAALELAVYLIERNERGIPARPRFWTVQPYSP